MKNVLKYHHHNSLPMKDSLFGINVELENLNKSIDWLSEFLSLIGEGSISNIINPSVFFLSNPFFFFLRKEDNQPRHVSIFKHDLILWIIDIFFCFANVHYNRFGVSCKGLKISVHQIKSQSIIKSFVNKSMYQ